MPRYEYAVRDESGNAISGEIVAPSRHEATRLLRMEGKFVVRLNETQDPQAADAAPQQIGSSRVRQDQVIFFANQLAIMVDTGVPLADALQASIKDEPLSGFRTVVEDVIEQVQGGQEFSCSLERHPRVFPRFFSNIIKASEASGLMGTMLQRAAAYMTQQRETRKRIKRAMAYPLFMLAFCFLVVLILLTFIIPRFQKIFASRGVALPTPTQMLLHTSNFLGHNWILVMGGLLVISVGSWYFLYRTSTGYRFLSWFKLSVPIVGAMYRKAYITNVMRTMGTMIDAGVSMLDTVAITRNIVDNFYYHELLSRVEERLQKGNMLSDSLRGTNLIPHTIVQMILAGERAGQMGPVMNRIADFCERDLNNAVKQSTSMIEPLLVVLVGGFVGAVAIALMLPVFKMSQIAHGGN
ncbi:MAG: Type II secretion system protein F [Phycisphaerae bacterium]|nr:Type II secretion system protein F [Phycisphaerae bacterium]